MANKSDKYPENAEGKFFVDRQCIDCDACQITAPNNFDRNNKEGHSFVKKQPVNREEVDACNAALEGCPVDAIGK